MQGKVNQEDSEQDWVDGTALATDKRTNRRTWALFWSPISIENAFYKVSCNNLTEELTKLTSNC